MINLPYRLEKPSTAEKSVSSSSRSINQPDSTHHPELPFLPDEIWDRIFSFMQVTPPRPIGYYAWRVNESVRRKAEETVALLAIFCRTSKRFYRLAIPRLYNQPPVWSGVDSLYIDQHWNRQFFRAISQQPEIAQCVKEARIGFHQSEVAYVWDTFKNVLGGLSQPSPIVKRMGKVLGEGLSHHIHKSIIDAETAFYVILIPGVERLELGLSEHHALVCTLFKDVIWKAKHLISPLDPPLACLKVLHLKSLEPTNPINIRYLTICLALPTLETFIATNVTWNVTPLPMPMRTNRNLITVHMHWSYLSEVGFSHILRQFPKLKSLKFEGGALCGYPPEGAVDWIGRLLQSFGGKLECLEFNHNFQMGGRVVGTLRRLKKLKTLQIAYGTLFTGWDRVWQPSLCMVLPFQLQYLHLHTLEGDQNQREEVIHELLLDERFLALNVLVIEEFDRFVKDVTGLWIVRWFAPRLYRGPWARFERIRDSQGLITDSTSTSGV